MRKIGLFMGLFLLTAYLSFGQSAGGGLSFFFPESLLDGSGSVSKEAGLSTSISLGEYLSVPVGVTYIKASGFMPYDNSGEDESLQQIDDTIWYTADTFIPFLHLKTHVPLGPVYVEAFGGIAGAWIVAPQTFDGAVGRYYGNQAEGFDYYIFENLETEIAFGLGYQIGGTVGFQIDAISVGIDAVLTDIRAETTLTSNDYYEVKVSNQEGTAQSSDFEETFTSRLRGISIGLSGAYSF